jgi:hypothetical protein
MPRKVFTAGEVLAAADVNSFLMDQAIQTFDSAAARSSAIGTATEGMVTWLNDQNALQVYDGTQWNGLAASGGNAIINGAFDIWQRGTSFNTNGAFAADRWSTEFNGGAVATSRQVFSPNELPISGFGEDNFYARVATSGQSTSGHLTIFQQKIESVRTLANQTVTLSFYAKSNSGTPKIATEFEQIFGSGGSPSSPVVTYAGQSTISTTWTRYSVTVTLPSLSGKTIGTNDDDSLRLRLWLSAGSDFNSRTGSIGIQNNTIDIWGVQVEAGPTANAFRRNANSLEGELAACQRYYYRYNAVTTGDYLGLGSGISGTAVLATIFLPVPLRAPATSVDFSSLRVFDGVSAAPAVSAVSLSNPSANIVTVALTSSSITTHRPYWLLGSFLPSFIGFSAEL